VFSITQWKFISGPNVSSEKLLIAISNLAYEVLMRVIGSMQGETLPTRADDFMRHKYLLPLLALLLAASCFGQTLVDLRTQSKSIDFSALPSTRPVQVGTVLPATCQVGQLFFKSDASAGANLYGCAATNIWAVQSSGTGGGSGAGASMASQLGDLQVKRTSSNVLTIGANCSASMPCNVRFGSTVFTINAGATAMVSGGSTGMLYIYVSGNGMLTVGHNLTVMCNGCAAQSGVTSFPPDSVPIATWSVTSGSLDAAGGQDFRAVLGTKNLIAGPGVSASDTNGNTVVSVDTSLVGLRVAPPSSAASACQAGSWSFDSNYLYVCIATNTWRRSQLSSW
jgi:hypothetical protein